MVILFLNILITVSDAVMNMGGQISLQNSVSFDVYQVLVELLDHVVVLYLIFWRTFQKVHYTSYSDLISL